MVHSALWNRRKPWAAVAASISQLGRGKAGNIIVNATNSVTLAGSDRSYNARIAECGEEVVAGAGAESGLFANTLETSTN